MTQEQVNQMIREAVERGRQKEVLRRRYMKMAAAIRERHVVVPNSREMTDDWRYWQIKG